MDLPGPPQAVVALAAFVRDRLAEVSGAVLPRWGRRDEAEVLPGADHAVVTAARQLAMVLVGAAAPFASTPYARARLIRQMHASGLLSPDEVRRTTTVLDAASAGATHHAGDAPGDTSGDAPGAPR